MQNKCINCKKETDIFPPCWDNYIKENLVQVFGEVRKNGYLPIHHLSKMKEYCLYENN